MHLTEEDREMAAKALWMASFEETLKACREMGLGSNATMVGMFSTMTSVVRLLFEDLRKEEN